MKRNHPSEEVLQEYALNTPAIDNTLARHISACEACKSKIAAYRFIAAEIRQSPVPGFEFDLAAEVLAQIPVNGPLASRRKWDYLLAAAFLLLLALPFYFYRTELAALFSEVSGTIVYTTGALALIILIIRVSEMDRSYHYRLRILNNSHLNNSHHLQH
jgi:hypothetical protein